MTEAQATQPEPIETVIPELWLSDDTNVKMTLYYKGKNLVRVATDRKYPAPRAEPKPAERTERTDRILRLKPSSNAKLTYAQADEIGELHAAEGVPAKELAERYGVSMRTVVRIIANEGYVR